MGFIIKGTGTGSKPAVICNHCQDEITDWKDGNVEYRDMPGEKEIMSFFTYHKKCSLQMGGLAFWMPLEDYLGWLLWNNRWGKIKDQSSILVPVRKSMDFSC